MNYLIRRRDAHPPWPGTPHPHTLPYSRRLRVVGLTPCNLTTVVITSEVINMATQTALKKVANAVTGLSAAVSNTFAEQAHAITNACRDAFGSVNWDIDKQELEHVVDAVTDASPWAGTASETVRRSEVTTVVRSYPFLGKACDVFKKEYGELRREHLVKIARICPTAETATDAGLLAVEFFETREKNSSKGISGASGKTATIGMGLGIIKNAATRKRNEIAFRKELAALCKKYNISY